MKSLQKAGFTIIETMLFLAISSLFIVGVIMFMGPSLANQRYQDSLTSLQSILQQQFSDTNNPSHDNSTYACSTASGNPNITDPGTGAIVASGTSDCVILGKFITTSDGKILTIKNVVGAALTGYYSNDLTALNNSRIQVSPVGIETYEIEWGATLKNTTASGGAVSNFSILILRSPISGAVRTFINPTTAVLDTAANGLVIAANLSNSLTACVDYDSARGLNKSALYVVANTSSAGGIELWGSGTLRGSVLNGC